MSRSVLNRISWRSPLVWIVVLQFVLLAWVAFRVGQVYLDLNAAKSAASKVESALKDQRVDDAKEQATTLRDRAAGAKGGTSGPTWKVLEHLPFLGDDVRTVGQVSDAVDLIARRVIPSAIEAADVVQGDGLIGKGGAIDLKAVRLIAPDVKSARSGVLEAFHVLNGTSTSGNIEKISSGYRDLRGTVGDLFAMLDSASRAVEVLPTMAGSSGARHYLLVLQNNAEIRSTGGLPGVIVDLKADHGVIERGDPVSTSTAFRELDAPILPLTAPESALFGNALGERVTESNLTPDFSRTADLIAARWSRDRGERVDGVLMMDTVTLAYLLKATGPITVQGVKLTEDNAVQQLLADTYVRLAGKYAEQDSFFQAVADEVFSRLTSGQVDAPDLLSALTDATKEGRIRVHSFNKRESRVLAGTEVVGGLSDENSRSEVGVYINDVTSAKMSIFLDYEVNAVSRSCQDGRQKVAMDLTLSSSAPKGMKGYDAYVTGTGRNAPIGSEALTVTLVAPQGGDVEGLALDRGKTDSTRATLSSRRALQASKVLLGPGQTRHLTWTVWSARNDTKNVPIAVTPSVTGGNKSFEVDAACQR